MHRHSGRFSGFLRAALLVSSLLGIMSCGGGQKAAESQPSDAAPQITSQPESKSVAAGKPVVFTVAVSDAGPVSYQWEKNGAKVGSNSATYTIPAATPSDDGAKVSVTVTNAAGLSTESAQATLKVEVLAEAPTITLQPQPMSVTVGRTATFMVEASGATPMYYHWKKNGVEVGEDNPAYTTPAASLADDGSTYSVLVTNRAGSAESEVVTLSVTTSDVAPTIQTQPRPVTVAAGQVATFRVVANGTTPMYYYWKKNGVDVGTDNPTLTTQAALSDNGAKFSVTVRNGAGSATSAEATLTVTASSIPPTITTQPQNRTVTAGYAATFSVAATGTTPFTYQWSKNGSPVGGNASSYTTPATTSADNGAVFSVVVTNPVGRVESRNATLTVSDATPPASTCAPAPTSSTVVNVKNMGAKGDGTTDDTRAIQSAVDAVKGSGGTVLIPAGTYRINKQSSNTGIRLGSNMTLRMDGALLQAIPSSNSSYYLVLASGVHDVNIVGGVVQGDYAQHIGTPAQGGMGVHIVNSQRVFVENVTALECWGDGFYIGDGASDVTLCSVTADGNCRAGMSITRGSRIRIYNSTFKNAHSESSSLPSCGMDIEPNEGEYIDDVVISGCTFEGNQAMGLASGEPCAHSNGDVSRVVIENNIIRNNRYSGIAISNSSGTRITQNTVTGNGDFGISLSGCGSDSSRGANDMLVSGNTVSNNGSDGIHQEYCRNNTITGNTGSGNGRYGVQSSYCTGTDVSGNTVQGAAGGTHATN